MTRGRRWAWTHPHKSGDHGQLNEAELPEQVVFCTDPSNTDNTVRFNGIRHKEETCCYNIGAVVWTPRPVAPWVRVCVLWTVLCPWHLLIACELHLPSSTWCDN